MLGTDGNLILLTGPIFMGTLFGWCFLGILITQVYVYFVCYPDDSRGLKCLVAGLFVLELVQTTLMTHYGWVMLIGNWGSNTENMGLPWSAATFSPMIGLISMIVQMFFAWRIWVLRVATNYPRVAQTVSILIVAIAMLQGCAGIYGGISFGVVRTFDKMASLTWIVELWLGGSFACDVLIAASMIAIFAEAGRGSPWGHTSTMVNKLVIHAIETGAVTALTALLDLLLFELFKNTSIHQAVASVLGKLYTNALLASLNGRKRRQDSIHALQQQSALSLSQIRTLSLIAGGNDMELTLRAATPDRMEESKSHGPIMVEIPKSPVDSLDDGDISMLKVPDSPV